MTRRFIAGARCPQCDALDRIQRVEENGTLLMLCVACGMQKDLDQPQDAPVSHGARAVIVRPAAKQK